MFTALGSMLGIKGIVPFVLNVVVSFAMLGIGINWFFRKIFHKQSLSYIDLLLISLSFLSVCSIFWSTQKGLAYNESSLILTLCLYVITIRTISIGRSGQLTYIFVTIILILLLVILSYFSYPSFNKTSFGGILNSNSASFYLLACCAFLINWAGDIKNMLLKLLYGLLFIWTFLLIVWMVSLGSIIIFVFIFLLFAVHKKSIKLPNWKSFAISLVGVVILVLLASKFLPISEILLEASTEGDRPAEYKLTCLLAKENFLFGHGFGNWLTMAYKNPLPEAELYINNPNFFSRGFIGSHNIFSKMLGELGVIGLVIFSIIAFLPISKFLRNKIQLNGFQESCFWTFYVYLGALCFYQFAMPHTTMTLPTIIGFTCLGVVSKSFNSKFEVERKYFNLIFVFISLLLCIKHGMTFLTNLEYTSSKIEKRYSLEMIQESENLYHPIFFSSAYPNTYLPFLFAERFGRFGNQEKAIHYYDIALKENPYNIHYLNKYAKYLIQQEDYASARLLITKSKYLHQSYVETNILDAKLLCYENKKDEALRILLDIQEKQESILTWFNERNVPPEQYNGYEYLTKIGVQRNLNETNRIIENFEEDKTIN